MSIDTLPAAGTLVRLKPGMPGTYEGQTAIVHHVHPTSGHSNLDAVHPLVWLECDVIWSHGTGDGFWAARAEYVVPDDTPIPDATTSTPVASGPTPEGEATPPAPSPSGALHLAETRDEPPLELTTVRGYAWLQVGRVGRRLGVDDLRLLSQHAANTADALHDAL